MMPVVTLPRRACLFVTGPDAISFLQNILTLDLDSLGDGILRPGALLTPQGKILFDFLASRHESGICLECRAEIAGDFARRLMMYRLRAKAEITLQEESLVAASWDTDSDASSSAGALRDERFPGKAVYRLYDHPSPATASVDTWHKLRIASGVAESGLDYELGDAFPHDVLLDQNKGVGFRKGCFVGQEVVSRMQHRGTARRRVLIAKGYADLPESGTALTVDGRPIGTMGSSVGDEGLALVRIDKVKAALDQDKPVLAGEISLTLSIPEWAGFSFPQTDNAQD